MHENFMKQQTTLQQEPDSAHERKLKVKGIFLDLDGTIVDSKEAYIEAARIAFQSVGQKPPETKVPLKFPEDSNKA